MSEKQIILDGKNLTIREVNSFLHNPKRKVALSEDARYAIRKSREFLEEHVRTKVLYGVNTGFGPMATHIISRDDLLALQKNLVRGHAVGIGQPMPQESVLAAMLVRANTLAAGYSGTSEEFMDRLLFYLNNRIIPVVPDHGSVGASGDLVELAHIGLALIGEGSVFFRGQKRFARDVLDEFSLRPYELKEKEGLAAINGTAAVSGSAAIAVIEAERIFALAVRTAGFAVELVNGYSDALSQKLHDLRPHKGQKIVAKFLREILADSKMMRERADYLKQLQISTVMQKLPIPIQDVYTIRCVPQILGPVFESLNHAWKIVKTEINSVTDNPILDWENETFIHGGNFHGDYVAVAMDYLKASLIKLTMTSERRINYLLNEKVNRRFAPFLNLKTPGLTMGLQGLQFVATSTAARNQSLSVPHSTHSISTNADNQDIVSMGLDAVRFTRMVIDNAFVVLAIELIALTQAADITGNVSKMSNESMKLFNQVRNYFPKIYEDRDLTSDLERMIGAVKQELQVDIDWKYYVN